MKSDTFDQWEKERRQRHEDRERRRAERRRERDEERGPERGYTRASKSGEGRKERVIHTRVSDSLDESIRRAAEELRVPVSNLVRNVLEDVFEVVEKVTDNMGDIVGDVLEEVDGVRRRIQDDLRGRPRRRPRRERAEDASGETVEAEAAEAPAEVLEREEFPDVVGWQPLILNAARQCVDCGRDLLRGDKAFVGLSTGGVSERTLCSECARARS